MWFGNAIVDVIAHADEAYLIGPGPAAESYLVVDKILDVVRESGAEAVHPGYGFLAENAPFAKACEDAGVVFIGPPASAIDSMGSKTTARELMKAAGVPIVPGTTETVETLEDAARIAKDEIGYPVAVKAAGGGGGKGFRVALTEDELQDAFEGASREGEKFFSDSRVYLERYLPDPRHVEVQIIADRHGNVIHLGERDCSVQRRHQKLIEESPAPAVDPELRARIGKIAIDAAAAVDYVGAGTVEGLLQDGEYFFLEMNTRVQVEHCVTEMTTGIDIVKSQITPEVTERKPRMAQTCVISVQLCPDEHKKRPPDRRTMQPPADNHFRISPPLHANTKRAARMGGSLQFPLLEADQNLMMPPATKVLMSWMSALPPVLAPVAVLKNPS